MPPDSRNANVSDAILFADSRNSIVSIAQHIFVEEAKWMLKLNTKSY